MYSFLCFIGDVTGTVFPYRLAYRLNAKRFEAETANSPFDYTTVLRAAAMK